MMNIGDSLKQAAVTVVAFIGIAVAVIAFVVGIVVGRNTIEYKEVVRHVKGDTISGNISDLFPVKETIPDTPELPIRVDTFYRDSIVYVAEKVDTAAIIADYIVRREYTPALFDDLNVGRLSLAATVQYNKLSDLKYEFVPIITEKTIYRSPTLQPFGGVSYNTFNQVSISFGTFYKRNAIELQYLYDLERRKKAWGVGYKYLF